MKRLQKKFIQAIARFTRIARIRTDYVHEQQARYRTVIADLEQRIANASTGERMKLNKKQADIDLDDGAKKNYAIFRDVLAKIK